MEIDQNNEDVFYLVHMYHYEKNLPWDTLEVRAGERFTIPEHYKRATVLMTTFDYRLQPGATYSVDGFSITKYLPDTIETEEFYPIWGEGEDGEDDLEAGNIIRFSLDGLGDRKWGYVNSDGKILVPAMYDEAGDLTNYGISVVKKEGKYFFLRFPVSGMSCQRLDDNDYDDLTGPHADTGHYSFTKKEWGDGRGLTDEFGQVVFRPHYDTMPVMLSDNVYLACKNGQKGLINYWGDEIIPFGEYLTDFKYFPKILTYG